MPGPINRRQAIGLGAVVLGGWAVGQVLRRTAPIGRDIGDAATPIVAGGGSPEDGPDDASLRLAVFTDYRCPACRHAFPAMEEAVRTDGKVRVIYKDWPIFGPASERAAMVALGCAEQGIYPAVHRLLMTDSRKIDDDMLRDLVASAGGDWPRVTGWLRRNLHAVEARLRVNGREAYSIGLTGTPGFLAERLLVMGAIDAGDFRRLFAKARASR
ncbi:DsbA family protein [Sphingomonas aliaeris]|uniref:DsbA family protein n=1 Tax=Sphingomonas aliaeris TaxID=2759526 RepID=A0A974NSB6_9SPHN|nr:DsbA family protein [Sphingomonas aliaeris]QQV75953.1 DsbA family protein [Sphingomonas aliaeris]